LQAQGISAHFFLPKRRTLSSEIETGDMAMTRCDFGAVGARRFFGMTTMEEEEDGEGEGDEVLQQGLGLLF
jgi:hypothetical protein